MRLLRFTLGGNGNRVLIPAEHVAFVQEFTGFSADKGPHTLVMVIGRDYVVVQGHVDEIAHQIEGGEHARLRTALRYITRPTMGLPSDADPVEFAMDGASEQNVRIALAGCIRLARQALAP